MKHIVPMGLSQREQLAALVLGALCGSHQLVCLLILLKSRWKDRQGHRISDWQLGLSCEFRHCPHASPLGMGGGRVGWVEHKWHVTEEGRQSPGSLQEMYRSALHSHTPWGSGQQTANCNSKRKCLLPSAEPEAFYLKTFILKEWLFFFFSFPFPRGCKLAAFRKDAACETLFGLPGMFVFFYSEQVAHIFFF